MSERLTSRTEYQSLIKNDQGEAEIINLEAKRYTSDAPDQDISERDFIRQAAPTIIRPSRRIRPTRRDELTIAFGDAQIGFRGEETFHDERAMALATVACRELQPDNIVLTGDMIDLPGLSRYEQRPDWQNRTQQAIDRYHTFLAQLRADSPNARIVAVGGNHEERMLASTRKNAAELLGLRQANVSKLMGVLTVPFLVRFDDLEVESVDGYPNAAHWLEEDLKVTHGTATRKGGSNAATYLNRETSSTIYGHTHRMEVAYRTLPFGRDGGARTILAASPGALARTTGEVPGHNHSVDSEGKTVRRTEDWQQGLLLVHHNPRNHEVNPVRITDEGMRIYDKYYELGESDA